MPANAQSFTHLLRSFYRLTYFKTFIIHVFNFIYIGVPFPGLSVTPQNSQNKGLTKAVHKLLTGHNKLLTGLSRSIFPFFPDSSTRRKQRTIYRRIRKNQILPISFFRQKPQTKTWHFPNLFPIFSQYYSLLLFMIWSIFFL